MCVIRRSALAAATLSLSALFAAPLVSAQDPAPGLGDLQGLADSTASRALTARGYVRQSESGDYGLWWNGATGEAVPADAVRVVARTRSARRWSTSAWAGMSATSTGVGAAESATVVHHCRFRCPAAASAPGRRRPDMPARRTAGRA